MGEGGGAGILLATGTFSVPSAVTSSPKSQPGWPLKSTCHQFPAWFLPVTRKRWPTSAWPMMG